METNCKTNKFNLDHVYCHSNDNNYIRTTKSSGAVDIMALIKENKQFKTMLLLHLDLIQEQSDQLQAKDKLLATLKEENEILKLRVEKLESEKTSNKVGLSSVHENNNKPISGLSVRSSYHRVHGKIIEASDLFKKNKNVQNNKHEDKKENLAEYSNIEKKKQQQQSKIKLLNNSDKLSPGTTATITTRSRYTPTPPGAQIHVQNDNCKAVDENSNNGMSNSGSIIGQSNGKPISKIMLQLHRVKIPNNILPNKSENIDDRSDSELNSFNMQLAAIFDNKEESPRSTLSSPSLLPPMSRSPRWFTKTSSPNLSLTVPLAKRSKISKGSPDTKIELLESPLSPLLEPKFEVDIKEEIKQEDTDDGFSCGSSGPDIEPVRRFIRCKSSSSVGESICNTQQSPDNIFSSNSASDSQSRNLYQMSKNLYSNSKTSDFSNNSQGTSFGNNNNLSHRLSVSETGKRKVTYLTTNKMYSAREWTTEGIPAEEFTSIKEEEEALKAEQPMLEIPKWVVKEVSCLYSIEGTEDLSDETFYKRHAKLEHDEKRRKKWDVQRIREQRTIERLKRRHCKDELIEAENQELISFYPTPDQIKFIQISDELPVEAFGGELIPRLNPSEFSLPWKKSSYANRLKEISIRTNLDHQTEKKESQQAYKHQLRNHSTISDSSFSGIGVNYNSSANATNSTFLFLKKRKKITATNTKRPQFQKNNLSTSNINNINNLSFNLSTSSSTSKGNNNAFESIKQNIDDKNISSNDDSSNIVEGEREYNI